MFIALARVAAQQPNPVSYLLHDDDQPNAMHLESRDGGADRLPRRLDGDRDRPPRDDAGRKSLAPAFDGLPVHHPVAALVSAPFGDRGKEAACSLASWLEPTVRIPPPRRSVRPSTWPSWPALSSASSAPTQPLPKRKVESEKLDAPADVQYELGPREDVNLVLDAAAAAARKEGVEVQTHPVQGEPAEAILNVAEETKADLIVVGNKGMTGARRFLLGSVPNNVSHHAPCSVIIVRTT